MAQGDGERAWYGRTTPAGPWDCVVIGSGVGGMTAAALLSKLGRRVLVLEQHRVPGGMTHTFRRKGYVFDTGVHVVGQATTAALPGRMLDDLTDGGLQWASLGPVYDRLTFGDDFELALPNRPKAYREALCALFPRERSAIDRYLEQLRDASDSMGRLFLARLLPASTGRPVEALLARKARRYCAQTTAEALVRLTRDERLRAAWTGQWGYLGLPPARSAFAAHATVASHYSYGGYYPVGGSERIAEQLLGAVARQGGYTRVAASVERILLERGRAAGVELESGERIRARHVLSAVGVVATVERLVPDAVRGQRWAREVARLRSGPAHVCLYLGLKGDVEAAGASRANHWFHRGTTWTERVWPLGAPDDVGTPTSLYCSFGSLKDPAHDPGPEQRHTAELLTFVPWESFARWQDRTWRRRGAEYDALKAAIQERLLELFAARYPRLAPMIDYVELSTPLSTVNFCRSIDGAMYGLEHTPERFACPWLRPRSPIPGLLFAGNEVLTAGVMGAMMGGAFAALSLAPVAGAKWLGRLVFG
ncbi:MAG: NAD(P)/FAD-dependent oxidoreductase [Deltaproteobacteria bacterium]|jgi:all-trans-retinol 13,14-reductase|nr:NAD(P)/FAD-dependent oxidoreductase [Deltaproteobacteria bacterium]MBW2532804.1 NAD(P)/FAD-dependent oxidoreductase [Deltaproteobacteria bacterium]